ncbi:MAG: hypothetical protein KY463_03285 [Actinobacteria bacterium]|nr:hypothetical protein [Actinomycetota bacterium]
MSTTQRHRTLARYELSLAAARDPELRAVLVRGGDRIRGLLAGSLAALGAIEPDGAAAEARRLPIMAAQWRFPSRSRWSRSTYTAP